MKRLLSTAAALALASLFTQEADAARRDRAPAAAQKLEVVDIPYETFTLSNGLRVVVHTDRKAPVVAVGIWYGVGSRDEEPGKTGFAHLFEHLMFNGTENYNDEYFKPFEDVGATDQNGTTWYDRTNYFQTVPTPALDLALWMESDRMGHLLGAVDQAKLDEQRGVVQNEKRQGDNQPYGLVEYSLLDLFPAGHPYSWSTIGSMADLNAASLDDVKAWFQKYYGAANAVLALVGDIDAASAKPLVEKYFGDIDPGPPLARREAAVPIRAANTRDILRDQVPQARIYRAWTAPGRSTREAALLDLASASLGGGKTSRLYEALVYEQKIATDVAAYLEEHELASILQIQLTLRDGVSLEDGAKALDAEIEKFLQSGPSQAELDRIRARRYAGFVRGIEKVGGFAGKMTVLAEGWLYSDDPGFYRTRLSWENAATPAEVKAQAQAWMRHGYHQVDVVPFGALEASGGGADRSRLPAVSQIPELAFPPIVETTLSNGAKLVLARRGGAPIVQVQAQFDGGLTTDVGAASGRAAFTMAMLDEGAGDFTALELAARAEELGAQIGAGAGLETSSVGLSALSANLTPSLALMADVIQRPTFDPRDIDRVRGIWLAQIQQEKASPLSLALRLLPPAIYGEASAYGAPLTGSGTEASIRSLRQEDLQAFHAERLRPQNATFYVVGDLSLDQAKAALEAAFSGWSADGGAPTPPEPKLERAPGPRLILIDRPNAPQSFILAGRATTPANTEDALAQEVMNDTLGGLFTARVNMNLREDKAWSYGARTFFRDARGPRPWMVYAPVQTEKTAESLAELRKELTDINAGRPITQEEFDRVIAQSVRSLPGAFETSGSVLGAISGAAALGRPLDWAASLTGRYQALTLAEAQAAARRIVSLEDLVWVVVGDRAKIEAGVKALNLAPIEYWDENGKPIG